MNEKLIIAGIIIFGFFILFASYKIGFNKGTNQLNNEVNEIRKLANKANYWKQSYLDQEFRNNSYISVKLYSKDRIVESIIEVDTIRFMSFPYFCNNEIENLNIVITPLIEVQDNTNDKE